MWYNYPRATGTAESIWLLYVRMLGAATAACICASTVLHQVQCELRQEPTHWLAALLLVLVSTLSFATLAPGTVGKSRYATRFAGACAITMALSISLVELCDVHLAFSATILGINVVACWLFMYGGSHGNTPKLPKEHAKELGGAPERRICKIEEDEHTKSQSENWLTSAHAVGGGAAGKGFRIGSKPEDEPSDAHSQESSPTGHPRPAEIRHAGWILFGIGFVIYMIVVPTIGLVMDWFTPVTSRELTDMTLGESIRLHTVSGVVMLMFLGMGASIGSFLNVVIYRLPRSIPLLWPPSACANCKTSLRGKDNIPVVAWFKLGGQCRYCGESISARYPVIEALVGLVFVLFYYRELLSGGVNLPVREPNFYHGIVWILLYTKWDLVTIYLFHMVLLALLLAWGMINHDRFRVPTFSVAVCCLAFLAISSAFPHLNPTNRGWTDFLSLIPASAVASLVGCMAGWILGLIINSLTKLREEPFQSSPKVAAAVDQPVEPGIEVADSSDEEDIEPASLYGEVSPTPTSSIDAPASLALAGAALGVEAVLVVFGLTAMLTTFATIFRPILTFLPAERRKLPTTVFVFVSTIVLLLFWDLIHRQLTVLMGCMA